jgi:hypothetical protein
MKLHNALLIALAAVVAACSDPKPEGFLDRQRMTALFVDIHIADAAADRLATEPAKRDSVRSQLYEEVMRKNNLSRQVFYANYHYYLAHPVELDSIYSKVLESLNKQLSAAESKVKAKNTTQE